MFRSSVRPAALAAVLVGLFATTSFADVLVVDASGGGNYTQIQAAVDAAVDGDTILVKSGSYVSFVVDDKALTIVGDTGASVQVAGAARVRDLSASKTFVLQRVTATGTGSGDTLYGLYLSNDSGHVRIESCTFTGAAFGVGNGYDAIRVDSCLDFALTRTIATGGGSPTYPSSCCNYVGGAGLHATSSTLTIYLSTLHGGNGAGNSNVNGGSGGVGCSASTTSLFASGSSFIGGDGGEAGAPSLGESDGGNGGDGMQLSSASTAYLLQDIEQGGAAGPANPLYPTSLSGSPGHARTGGAFTDLPGTSRRMHSETPVRENTSIQLTFTGTPGEQVALVVANSANHTLELAWNGVLLVTVGQLLLSMPVGTIPQGGTLTVPWDVPDLGGLSSRVFHLQPVFRDAQGNRTLGNASSMVILSHLF
jgi:hypothetical protein